MFDVKKVSIEWGGETLTLETGKVARQADGAVVATLGAWLLGFRGPELGILFLYFGAPTAAASFVMARAAEGNHELAAAIIVITTLMAAVTTNIGIFVLQAGGWI